MPWAWGASFLLAQEGLGDTAICRAQIQTVSPCQEGSLCQQTEMPRLNVAWAGRAWATRGGKTERSSSERRLLALCSGSCAGEVCALGDWGVWRAGGSPGVTLRGPWSQIIRSSLSWPIPSQLTIYCWEPRGQDRWDKGHFRRHHMGKGVMAYFRSKDLPPRERPD